jgi:voltage-dependent potassium channel beta subunit
VAEARAASSMGHRRVGTSGLVVSEVALGGWLTWGASVTDDSARACIRTAIEHGVTFLDTADVYAAGKAESLLGSVIRDYKRSDLVIATKAYFRMSDNPNDRGLSRKHLFESLHKSLGRLGTDYVDIFQCHRFDPDVPVAETVRAMDDLIRQGKALYWGVSMWSAEQLREAIRIADATGASRPISNQPEYNLLERSIEESVMPFCEREGIGQVVFSPLAEGLLTGKYAGGHVPEGSRGASETWGRFVRDIMTPGNHAIVARLAAIAADAGMPLALLALAWILRQKNVASVIVGASRPEQIRENVRAAGVRLEAPLLREIDAALSESLSAS